MRQFLLTYVAKVKICEVLLSMLSNIFADKPCRLGNLALDHLSIWMMFSLQLANRRW